MHCYYLDGGKTFYKFPLFSKKSQKQNICKPVCIDIFRCILFCFSFYIESRVMCRPLYIVLRRKKNPSPTLHVINILFTKKKISFECKMSSTRNKMQRQPIPKQTEQKCIKNVVFFCWEHSFPFQLINQNVPPEPINCCWHCVSVRLWINMDMMHVCETITQHCMCVFYHCFDACLWLIMHDTENIRFSVRAVFLIFDIRFLLLLFLLRVFVECHVLCTADIINIFSLYYNTRKKNKRAGEREIKTRKYDSPLVYHLAPFPSTTMTILNNRILCLYFFRNVNALYYYLYSFVPRSSLANFFILPNLHTQTRTRSACSRPALLRHLSSFS